MGKTSVLNDGTAFSAILWSESGYEFIDIEVGKDLVSQLENAQAYEEYLQQNWISFDVTGTDRRYAGPQATRNSYVIQFYRDCGEDWF